MSKPARHILCMSGGEDSTARALYGRDPVSEGEHRIAFLAFHCCRRRKMSLRED
jgi:hypothetical protein